MRYVFRWILDLSRDCDGWWWTESVFSNSSTFLCLFRNLANLRFYQTRVRSFPDLVKTNWLNILWRLHWFHSGLLRCIFNRAKWQRSKLQIAHCLFRYIVIDCSTWSGLTGSARSISLELFLFKKRKLEQRNTRIRDEKPVLVWQTNWAQARLWRWLLWK